MHRLLLWAGLTGLDRAAWRLVAMRFLFYVGFQASYFVGIIGTLTYAAGAGAVATSAAIVLMNATLIAGSFTGGALLDALGPRRHFAIAVGAMAASSVLLIVGGGDARVVMAGAAAIGFSMGLGDVIARSYPSYLTGDTSQLKRINAAVGACSNIAVIAGPLAGGAIAAAVPSHLVFVFTLVCVLVALVPARGFRPRRVPGASPAGTAGKAGAAERGGATLAAGVRAVTHSQVLSLLFWIGFLCYCGYGAFDPLESLFYRDVLRVDVSWMGWLPAMAGVGAVAGSLLAGRLPVRALNMRALLIIMLFEGIGCLIYVGTSSVAVACAGQLILGVAFGAFTPVQNTLVQANASLEVVGRVSSIMSFGFNVAGVLPLLAAPALAQALGVQGTLIAASLVVCTVPVVLMPIVRRRFGAAWASAIPQRADETARMG